MTVDEIRKALDDRNLEKVSKAVGMTRAALSRIRTGRTKEPKPETMAVLENYLNGGAEK